MPIDLSKESTRWQKIFRCRQLGHLKDAPALRFPDRARQYVKMLDAENIACDQTTKHVESYVMHVCGMSLSNLSFHLFVIRCGQGFLVHATLSLLSDLVLSSLSKKIEKPTRHH